MQEDLSTLRYVDLDDSIKVIASTIIDNLDSYIPAPAADID